MGKHVGFNVWLRSAALLQGGCMREDKQKSNGENKGKSSRSDLWWATRPVSSPLGKISMPNTSKNKFYLTSVTEHAHPAPYPAHLLLSHRSSHFYKVIRRVSQKGLGEPQCTDVISWLLTVGKNRHSRNHYYSVFGCAPGVDTFLP